MAKNVFYNGIEMSVSEYDASATSIFDYLEGMVRRLEDGLNKSDGSFNLSVNVDFVPNQEPATRISATDSTNTKTTERVAQILEQTTEAEKSNVSGTIRVNLKVEDQKG